MRTKSAYREKSENIPADIPKPNIEIRNNGVPVDTSTATVEVPRSEVEVDEAFKRQAEPDPTLALQKQIEELRKSEDLQRQYAAAQHAQQMAHQQPPSREQLLHAWRAQGMSEAEAEFLRGNPELIDTPQLTAFAANEAAKSHQRGTEAHMNATREIFHRHLQAAANPAPTAQPTPAFFEPPPPPEPPDSSAMYSAPVSREVPSAGYREPSPSSVRLSLEERQHAAASGISEFEYAKQKLRLEREKRAGMRQ